MSVFVETAVGEGGEAGDGGRIVRLSIVGGEVVFRVLSEKMRGSCTRVRISRSSDADVSSSEVCWRACSAGGLSHRNFGGCVAYVGSLFLGRVRSGGVRSAWFSVGCCVGICEADKVV